MVILLIKKRDGKCCSETLKTHPNLMRSSTVRIILSPPIGIQAILDYELEGHEGHPY
jgi:hypothetical protein